MQKYIKYHKFIKYQSLLLNFNNFQSICSKNHTIRFISNNSDTLRQFSSLSNDNIKKNAVIMFPGQGSQYEGMFNDFINPSFSSSKQITLNKAKSILNNQINFKDLSEKDLLKTVNCQPAVYLHSLLLYNLTNINNYLHDKYNIQGFMGHSLGEYTALTAANIINWEDGLNLVHQRGLLMQQFVDQSNKLGMCAFSSSKNIDNFKDILIKFKESNESNTNEICEIANYNTFNQIVLSGHINELIRFKKYARKYKIRGKMIKVNCPFHSSLLKDTALKFHNNVLSNINFNLLALNKPVITNTGGKIINNNTKIDIREYLKNHCYKPVNWISCIKSCITELDTQIFIEIGPGNVLSNLTKKVINNLELDNKKIDVINISKP